MVSVEGGVWRHSCVPDLVDSLDVLALECLELLLRLRVERGGKRALKGAAIIKTMSRKR